MDRARFELAASAYLGGDARAAIFQTDLPALLVLVEGEVRKEVIQPHLPVRLPCCDLALLADSKLDPPSPKARRPCLESTRMA